LGPGLRSERDDFTKGLEVRTQQRLASQFLRHVVNTDYGCAIVELEGARSSWRISTALVMRGGSMNNVRQGISGRREVANLCLLPSLFPTRENHGHECLGHDPCRVLSERVVGLRGIDIHKCQDAVSETRAEKRCTAKSGQGQLIGWTYASGCLAGFRGGLLGFR